MPHCSLLLSEFVDCEYLFIHAFATIIRIAVGYFLI